MQIIVILVLMEDPFFNMHLPLVSTIVPLAFMSVLMVHNVLNVHHLVLIVKELMIIAHFVESSTIPNFISMTQISAISTQVEFVFLIVQALFMKDKTT